MKIAKLLGTTNYEIGERLNGCENDAILWSKILENYKYETEIKCNISKDEIISIIEKLVESLKIGDTGLFFYSGHGLIRERNNSFREGIITTDARIIWDKEIDDIKKSIPTGVNFIFIFDTCHSEGIFDVNEKAVLYRIFDEDKIRKEYILKSIGGIDSRLLFLEEKVQENQKTVMEGDISSENIITLGACGKFSNAYEKYFGNTANGIFSYYAKKITENSGNLNYIDFINKINRKIKEEENIIQTARVSDPHINGNKNLF